MFLADGVKFEEKNKRSREMTFVVICRENVGGNGQVSPRMMLLSNHYITPLYKADDYIEFTAESESILIYEPPFTKDHSKNELKQFIDAKLDLNICNNSVLSRAHHQGHD